MEYVDTHLDTLFAPSAPSNGGASFVRQLNSNALALVGFALPARLTYDKAVQNNSIVSDFHPYACRKCGATSYRSVIDRDGTGALRPTGLFHCSGCTVVFIDPKAWRDGEVEPQTTLPSTAVRPPPHLTSHSRAPTEAARETATTLVL